MSGTRIGINARAAAQALTTNPKSALAQVLASLWGVALLVGLFSPIKGFEQETLDLLNRRPEVLERLGLGHLSSSQLDAFVPCRARWRTEHIAKWNRGIAFVTVVCLTLGMLVTANTALSQLKDRVQEMGMRKVCGASNRDLVQQVLVEGAVTSTLGGAIGVGVGLVVSRVGAELIELPYVVSPSLLGLAFVAAVTSGLLSAAWPAMRVRRLSPVEALHAL